MSQTEIKASSVENPRQFKVSVTTDELHEAGRIGRGVGGKYMDAETAWRELSLNGCALLILMTAPEVLNGKVWTYSQTGALEFELTGLIRAFLDRKRTQQTENLSFEIGITDADILEQIALNLGLNQFDYQTVIKLGFNFISHIISGMIANYGSQTKIRFKWGHHPRRYFGVYLDHGVLRHARGIKEKISEFLDTLD